MSNRSKNFYSCSNFEFFFWLQQSNNKQVSSWTTNRAVRTYFHHLCFWRRDFLTTLEFRYWTRNKYSLYDQEENSVYCSVTRQTSTIGVGSLVYWVFWEIDKRRKIMGKYVGWSITFLISISITRQAMLVLRFLERSRETESSSRLVP